MTPLITEQGFGEPMLACPQCPHNPYPCTHIVTVTVTAREEDQPGTQIRIKTTVRDNITISETNGRWRRNHTTLTIWCEHCWLTTDITFQQHKGSTYITWEPKGGPSPRNPL